jgi:hypothetical protein
MTAHNLNTRPRQTSASADSLMTAHFELTSLTLAKWQFDDLRKYMSLAHEFVVRQQRDFQTRVDEYVAQHAPTDEDDGDIHISLEDENDQLHSRFPRLVFSSTLLMACALFESSLVDLCKVLWRALPRSTSWSELRDSGITKAATFLKMNYGIQLSNYSRWEQVNDYFKVRNCIVHADGDMANMTDTAKESIRQAVQRYGSVGLRETYGHVEIEQDFVSAVIKDLVDLWPLLEDACIENETIGPHYWP